MDKPLSQERLSENQLNAIAVVLNDGLDVNPYWIAKLFFEVKRLQAIEAEKNWLKAGLTQVATSSTGLASSLKQLAHDYLKGAEQIE